MHSMTSTGFSKTPQLLSSAHFYPKISQSDRLKFEYWLLIGCRKGVRFAHILLLRNLDIAQIHAPTKVKNVLVILLIVEVPG